MGMAQEHVLDRTRATAYAWLDEDLAAQPDESPLDRLASELIDRGAGQVSVEPEGTRTVELLHAIVNGVPVQVWALGMSFVTGCGQTIGSVSDPEGTADRIAAPLAGTGSGR